MQDPAVLRISLDTIQCISSRCKFRAKNSLQHFHMILIGLVQYISRCFHAAVRSVFRTENSCGMLNGLGWKWGVSLHQILPRRSFIISHYAQKSERQGRYLGYGEIIVKGESEKTKLFKKLHNQ